MNYHRNRYAQHIMGALVLLAVAIGAGVWLVEMAWEWMVR